MYVVRHDSELWLPVRSSDSDVKCLCVFSWRWHWSRTVWSSTQSTGYSICRLCTSVSSSQWRRRILHSSYEQFKINWCWCRVCQQSCRQTSLSQVSARRFTWCISYLSFCWCVTCFRETERENAVVPIDHKRSLSFSHKLMLWDSRYGTIEKLCSPSKL